MNGIRHDLLGRMEIGVTFSPSTDAPFSELFSPSTDDADETIIAARVAEYKNKTEAVADYYRKSDKVVMVPGEGSIDEIFERLSVEIEKRM